MPISMVQVFRLRREHRYWVVVTTTGAASQNATTAVWWEANAAEGGFNLNDGNGWVAGPIGAPGAFPSRSNLITGNEH